MDMAEILIVDDTDTNLEILSDLLGESYEVMVALDGEFALEIADNDLPDLILLDIIMPGMDGYEVCQKLKENPKTKDIPVIFITSETDEEAIEKAYDVGGIDYVTKPFKPKELLARVKTQIKLHKLVHDLEVSQTELKLLASTDSMTKLYNRRYFISTSDSILELAKRNKTSVSVIILDIDKFKTINDIYGHNTGDSVIISLANILQEKSRKSDVVSRWGGEEFVMLLPDTTKEGALIIGEKIRTIVEELKIFLDDKKALKFTISLGITQVDNEKDSSIDASINRADKALYEAKNSGRNQACIN